MRAKTYFFFKIILLLFLGCKHGTSSSSGVADREDFSIVNIDPQKSKSLKTSDFTESVEYIQLETTIESQFSEISQIESIGDSYIILDKTTNQILFFRKDGKFLNKISPDSEELPSPYKNIPYFTIDHAKHTLYFNDLHSANIFEFNLKGDFLKAYPKKRVDYNVRQNHHFNEYKISYFAYQSFPLNEKSPHNVIVSKDGVQLQSYLQFDASNISRNDVYGTSNYFFESGNLVYFTKPYDENIYCFDASGKMFTAFRYEFPSHLKMPDDFTTNPKYTKKRKQFLSDNGAKIYLITDFFKINENLIFRLAGGKYSERFLYNLSNKSLINLTKYVSDSTVHFLPILGRSILGVDGDKILSSFSSDGFIDLVNKQNKHGGNEYSLPKKIKEIYERGNDQNPILVLANFKKQVSYDTTF